MREGRTPRSGRRVVGTRAVAVLLAVLVMVATPFGRAVLRRAWHAVERARGLGTATSATRPLLALVIDDFGYLTEREMAPFLALDIPFSAAVLPFQEFSRRSAELGHAAGKEIMLHLPMEGGDGRDPGPDALLVGLDEASIRSRTRKALDDLSFVAGVNNHMGSRVTADSARMRWILEEIRARRLFFVDSRTTDASVAQRLASSMGIPTTSRQVFLDNDTSFAGIEREWARALRFAEKDGRVLVIGHVYPGTPAALRILVARDRGRVQFVLASALVE